jgi:hypothetical protein
MKPENFDWGGYCSETGICDQYSCLAESKSLVIKSCSVEKVHFKVVKFV